MATYIPGVGSYLPEFKPFTPDYKFLSNVLDTKTTKYETNYKALNDLYSQVVFGNLSRKDTQEMRDQYAEMLAPKLQQIAGMDLSMAQNVDAAKALFRPFYEEDLIVKDLAVTKLYRNEMQKAEALRNSSSAEQRELYWDTGVQKMQYQMEDFVNASEDQALGMGMIKYTPDSDLYQMAMDYLIESGLSTDVQVTPSEDGQWMIRRKNGELITNEALRMVQKALKDDPRVINAYHADAFVKSRQHADRGIEEGRFSSIDQGQFDWATNKIAEIEGYIDERTKKLEQQQKAIEGKNIAWENATKQNGVVKGSKEEKLAKESASDWDALKARIRDNAELKADEPEAEKDFKSTGEYKPQDTKSLLYRAYSLMMNYNMQTDLEAAAIDYSKRDMMLDLEANEFAVMNQRYKYDMSKIAAEAENRERLMDRKAKYDWDLEQEKARLKAEANATGSDKLAGLGSAIQTTEINTLTVGAFDDEGNLNFNGDLTADQENFAVDSENKIMNNEIDLLINYLERTQSQSNSGSGLINLDGVGSMSATELSTELKHVLTSGNYQGDEEKKNKYKTAFDNAFNKMDNSISNLDPQIQAFGDGSPMLFDSENPAAEFAALQNGLNSVKKQRAALNHHLSNFYEATDWNVKNGAGNRIGELDKGNEYADLLAAAIQKGMPRITYQKEDGSWHRYTEEEYQKAYSDWIKSGGGEGLSVEGVDADGFDDTSWYSGSGAELAWSDADDRYANLGEAATVSGVGPRGQFSRVHVIGTAQPLYDGAFDYNKSVSDVQASAFYNSMLDINNFAMKGKLEYDHAIETASGDKIEADRIFKVYDIKQGMRGVDESQMNSGEILNNPSYSVMLDPLAVSDDAAEFLKLADHHIQNGETEAVYIDDVGFNKSQVGDTGWFIFGGVQDDNEELLNPDDYDGTLEAAQHDLGKSIYNQYIMDVTKRRTTESKAQGAYPSAKITYFSSWTSDAHDLDSPYAGYTIEFSQEWMKTLSDEQQKYGNVLNVVINKNSDKNPRKFGEYNFSYVGSEISASKDKSFKQQVPGGGSYSVTQGIDGNYSLKYDLLQFNNTTGEWDQASFMKPLVNDRGEVLGQNNRAEVDFYVNRLKEQYEKIAENNITVRNAWMTANPNAVIKDPKYLFSPNPTN